MFRITKDPSSGSLVQCLAIHYKNGSVVSVGMDKVGVMAAYCDCNYIKQGRSNYSIVCCHNTDHVHVNGRDRTILVPVVLAKYCIMLPDDGSFAIRNMLEHF